MKKLIIWLRELFVNYPCDNCFYYEEINKILHFLDGDHFVKSSCSYWHDQWAKKEPYTEYCPHGKHQYGGKVLK